MKLPCKVIEDILPLYHDGVCSGESRALVEEHLRDCESCRALLETIGGELSLPKETQDDLAPLREIRSEWIKIRKRSLLKGILGTLLAVLLLFGTWWGLTELRVFPVPAEKIEVSDVSVLENGVIAFHLYINDGKVLNRLTPYVDYEDGVAYITPERSLIESKYPKNLLVSNDRFYYMELLPFTKAQFSDPACEKEIAAFMESLPEYHDADYSFTAEVTKLCIGTRSSHVVLWEKGMELPTASGEREKIYQSGVR